MGYKDGRTLKKYYCMNCKKELSNYKAKRCGSCARKKDGNIITENGLKRISESNKGKNNTNYGKKPINFKGIINDGHGYKLVFYPEHPNSTKQGYVPEHRLIMEKHLGRYLLPKEVVHHRNKIKIDNHIKNLFLFTTNELHLMFHQIKKYRKTTEEKFMEFIKEEN